MASSLEKWRAPHTAGPCEWTSLLGHSQEQAMLGGSVCRRLGSEEPRAPETRQRSLRPSLPHLNENISSSRYTAPVPLIGKHCRKKTRRPGDWPYYRSMVPASLCCNLYIPLSLLLGTLCRALRFCVSLCSICPLRPGR